MKYVWQVLTTTLLLMCVCCYCAFVDYERIIKDDNIAYDILLEEYKTLERENEVLKTAYKDMLVNELKQIDEYIAWKETLTALHKISIPDIKITDEQRQEFWDNYFFCQNIEPDTTLEE